MSNIPITQGTGQSSVATETISTVDYQKIKVVDGTAASVNPWKINSDGSAQVSVVGALSVNIGTQSGSVVGFQGGTRFISGSVLTLFAPVASLVSGVTSVITSTSQTSVLATAPGAQRNYITQILVTNGSATGTFVDIIDGSNVIYSGYAAGSGGGYALSFPTPLKQTNTVTSIDMKARAQASIITAISGYTAA